ncbi:hypothetical protein [Streptomyces erythrochromogenes]|uniref:hypothetical protein n=1 Tax=Streptomyces erythrochromogenes TaxID=285574 RepID=UPI0034015883
MTDTCRALLLRMAAYLDRARPDGLMWAEGRRIVAGQVAAEHYGIRADLVADAEAELLDHAPEVAAGITRHEYAEQLRTAAA